MEILASKGKEIAEFLTSSRIQLFEDALESKMVFDTFKSYYDETGDSGMDLKRTWVSNLTEFYDENLCIGRSVNSLEFSPNNQELLLAGFSSQAEGFENWEPNGLVMIYNIQNKKKPELIIKQQTEITASSFHQYNPKLCLAATYTGQIFIYDIRAGPTPVLKTPIGNKLHSHPIYCIRNIGYESSNQICSISSDGKVRIFSMSNMSKVLNSIDLTKPVENKLNNQVSMEDIGVICMAFSPGNTDHLYVGSDDCDIYQVYLGQVYFI